MPHPVWKGFLRLSLISLPVKAYSASASGGEIHLNQLHAECHSRIKYKKTCPIHGEVPNDQIVSGYEYSKGQYVVIDAEDLDKMRPEDEKGINIEGFIEPGALDPVYFSGTSYYLVPEGPVGQKPYALLHQAMLELEKNAIARVVMHGHDQVVLLRPADSLLTMTVLSYENEIKKPSAFEDALTHPKPEAEESKLTNTLIEASSPEQFDFARYKDDYSERLRELIDKKAAGEEIVASPVHEQAQIVNLMDALRQSLAEVQKGEEAEAKPPKKMAASVRKKDSAGRKKRSG
jgi:DNA end-binding protein Ku